MTTEKRGDVMDYLAAIPISNARQIGLKILGIGIAILGANVLSLLLVNRYYPVVIPFAFPALLGGLCLVLVGQPRSTAGIPALWGRVVLIASATIGMGIGVGVAFLLLRRPD